MKKPITIKDIAKALNISASTVSRALKDHPDISQETKDIVNAYAKNNNYKPNALASNLRMSINNTIGVIVPEIVHFFFSSILAGIEDYANRNGYNVIICQSNERTDKEIKNVQAMINSRVAGILLCLSSETTTYGHLQEIVDNEIPLVLFFRTSTAVPADQVVVDDYTGAYEAVEYLIQTGCKRIAFYSSPLHLDISRNRRNGYMDALSHYGIPADEKLIKICDTREEAIIITPELLDSPDRPDGFLAMNDHCAAGILYATKLAGLNVPYDVAICGFSDGEIAKSCDPMLTTVEQHGHEIGRSATEMLINRIHESRENTGRQAPLRKNTIETNLIIRGTTK